MTQTWPVLGSHYAVLRNRSCPELPATLHAYSLRRSIHCPKVQAEKTRMPFVKLDCKILQSTLWLDVDARWIFITALLMARPWYTDAESPQLCVNKLEETGWNVSAGAYGLVEAAGPCIVHEAGIEGERGFKALERLGAPDEFSRSDEFQGRRLVRVNHGYLVLNYMRYRETRDDDVKRAYMRNFMAKKRSFDPEYGRKS